MGIFNGWKKCLATTLMCLLTFTVPVFSQESNRPLNKYVYLKNNFTIGYQMGWNKTQFELEQGTAIPESPPGLLNELNFTYTFQLKRDFSLSVRAGYPVFRTFFASKK